MAKVCNHLTSDSGNAFETDPKLVLYCMNSADLKDALWREIGFSPIFTSPVEGEGGEGGRTQVISGFLRKQKPYTYFV